MFSSSSSRAWRVQKGAFPGFMVSRGEVPKVLLLQDRQQPQQPQQQQQHRHVFVEDARAQIHIPAPDAVVAMLCVRVGDREREEEGGGGVEDY